MIVVIIIGIALGALILLIGDNNDKFPPPGSNSFGSAL